ncbi:MAG: hypothetical protein ACYCOR_17155 [Acidobacteriaceae bacterium]
MRNDPVIAPLNGDQSEKSSSTASATFSAEEQEFATALLAVGGVADRAMVCRAQRSVRVQAVEIAERRRRARHGIGITILGFSLLLLVLTPVFWSGMQMLVDPKNFPASELQFVYVIAWLFPVTLVTLFLVFLRTRAGGGTRRIDHRVTSRLDSMVR